MRTLRSSVLIAIPWLLLAAALAFKSRSWSNLVFGDFHVYYVAGQSVLAGTDLYGLDPSSGLSTTLRFTYPPFAALIMALFGMLPFALAGWLFVALAVAALIVTCFLIARMLPSLAGRPLIWSTRELTLLMLALAVVLHPVMNTISNGQIGLFLLLMIFADFVLVSSRFRGILTGLATGIKLTPGVFIVLFAAAKRWRECGLACAAFVCSFALGWLLQPAPSREYWFNVLFDRERVGDASDPENTSLLGLFSRLFPAHAELLWLPLAVIILGLTIWQAAKWYPLCPLVSMVMVAMTSLLISPMSWSHHWFWALVAIPLLAVFVIRAREQLRIRLAWAVSAVIAVFLAVAIAAPDEIIQRRMWRGFVPEAAVGSEALIYQLMTAAYPVVGLLVLATFAGCRSLFTQTDQLPAEPESPADAQPIENKVLL